MNREARGVILAFVAVVLLRLSLTDDHLLYVKASMRPWLIVSGVLLAGLALVDVFGWLSRPGHDGHDQPVAPDPNAHSELSRDAVVEDLTPHGPHAEDDHAGHRHGMLPWILVAPFVVVYAIGPSPLGAFMAERQPATERVNTEAGAAADMEDAVESLDEAGDPAGPVKPGDVGDEGDETGSGVASGYSYPPPPPAVDGAIEMHIADFASRAAYDEERQMEGKRIRLEGFVVPDPEGPGDTFLLTKFMLSCCAADGIPVSVRVHGLTPIPPADTWLRVEGFWIPQEGEELPPVDEFDLVASEEIPVPDDPYL